MRSRIMYVVLFLIAAVVLSGSGYYCGLRIAETNHLARVEHITLKSNSDGVNNKIIQTCHKSSASRLDSQSKANSQIAKNNARPKKKSRSKNKQAIDTIDTIVIHAITRGKWTKYDNQIFYSYLKHLNEKQRTQVLIKLGEAINLQQLKPGFYLPSS